MTKEQVEMLLKTMEQMEDSCRFGIVWGVSEGIYPMPPYDQNAEAWAWARRVIRGQWTAMLAAEQCDQSR
jgi:hypothetical protein